MNEWLYLILGLGATFGLLVFFMMIMSIVSYVVMLSELENKKNTHSPSKLFADELNEALKEDDT